MIARSKTRASAMDKSESLCLASGSVQRLALLQQLGLHCRVMPMDIDETRQPHENATEYVHRLAVAKALAAYGALGEETDLPVLGADTTVVLGDNILEKPADHQHAAHMLRLLSGSTHQVYTGAGIVGRSGEYSVVVETAVTFRPLTTADIEGYIATGEPFGKAGAYAIQGRAAAFIENISGSYSNVMGLPLFEIAGLLANIGIDIMKLPD